MSSIDNPPLASAAPGVLHAIQVFDAGATYTPTAGTTRALVKSTGAGGGGGDAPAPGSTFPAYGDGGAGGGTRVGLLTIDDQVTGTVTIGVGGAGAGTSSSLLYQGDTIEGTGGARGVDGIVSAINLFGAHAQEGGGGADGDYTQAGGFGGAAEYTASALNGRSGQGGHSLYGPGAKPLVTSTSTSIAGAAGVNKGEGGSGGAQSDGNAATGGVGAGGRVIIMEYR